MNLVVTNISSAPVAISDLYTTIPVAGSVTTIRSASQISAMVSLQKAVESGLVTVSATETTYETASGLTTVPGTVGAADTAPVAAAVADSMDIVIRVPFTSVSSTDIAIFAANALPYKMRILDAYLLISTVQAASTLQLFPQAAGGGTAITTATSAAVAGRIPMPLTGNASVLVTPGTLIGLFLRPSAHTGIVGEVVINARRES